MRFWKLVDVRFQAKLAKGLAKDLVKTQEVIDDSDDPESIINTLESGKLHFKAKKKAEKSKQHNIE